MILLLQLTSCEDYLDKTIESDLKIEDVFKDFEHAQGFIEQCYMYVVSYSMNTEWNAAPFLLGDETLGYSSYMADRHWDEGTLTEWRNTTSYFYKSPVDITNENPQYRCGIWNGWEAIRIANLAIENIDLMTGATETEKKLILGQAYFFRAYFHNEIMKFWGRIPYIDRVLSAEGDDYKIPRPVTYEECALKADADYAKAAELLPYNWDDLQNDPNAEFLTFRGETFGNNLMRINKAIVYSFKGKNLLLAASPLMQGNTDTYAYDQELCELAAQDFAKVIEMDRQNINQLGLATKDNYKYVFYTKNGWSFYQRWPGTAKNMESSEGEFIFSAPAGIQWKYALLPETYMPYSKSNTRIVPNHHFIHNTFGTANGLACDEDPTFDPQQEFENRDPRFHEWLIIDGDKIIEKPTADLQYKYARLYTGGLLRGSLFDAKHTGYFIKKWGDITFNSNTKIPGGGDNQVEITAISLQMRLTDVYLMYAEALTATDKYGVDKAPEFMSNLSALGTINMLRDRFNVPHVEDSYGMIGIDIKANKNKFMDVVRRERAMELCFEGHRWTDIRRWVVAHLEDYKIKSAIDFDRDNPDSNGDRSTFKNINFKERVILKRVCDYPKHFWLPFEKSETLMFEGFEQNPGW